MRLIQWHSSLGVAALIVIQFALSSFTAAAPLRSDVFSSVHEPRRNLIPLKIGTVVPQTVKSNLERMLAVLDHTAAERFVTASPISATSFGSDDPVTSNSDFRDEVDHVFTANDSKAGNEGWVDTYIKFLIDAGQEDNQTLTEQYAIVDDYTNAITSLAEKQMQLLQAFQDANKTEVTNIGTDIPDSDVPKLDPLTMHAVEQWAVNNGTQSGKVSKEEYDDYVKANQTVATLKPQYDQLSESITVAAQGYMLKKLVNSYPGVFNLSMLVGGDPSSPQAQFAPAWTATVINTTLIMSSDAKELQDNLNGNLGNSSSTSTTGHSSTSSSTVHSSISASSTSSTSTAKSATVSARNGIQVAGNYSLTTGHRRLVSRNGLHVAGNSTIVTGSVGSGNVAPLSRLQSKKAVSGNSSVALSPGNSTDFLADVPDIPLQGNLMLLSLNEGSWANQRDDFINYARREHPDIAQKYFGNGTSGSGPIGRHWTHMVLITLTKPNSTELASVQILGKVYDVLPVLKSNSTAPSNTTAIGFV